MNKAELVEAVAARLRLSPTVVAPAIDAVLSEIERAVAKGKRISIKGFGTFEGRYRVGYQRRDPRTGQQVEVPARIIPIFVPGYGLEDDKAKESRPPRKERRVPWWKRETESTGPKARME